VGHIPDDVVELLKHQHWSGTVREVSNVIDRAVIATNGGVLQAPDVELRIRDDALGKDSDRGRT
jgi:transcriptional regulator of acetoin/glycerol metabolism